MLDTGHKSEGLVDGFAKDHGLKRLVYYEWHDTIQSAIQREKNIKHWPRACLPGPKARQIIATPARAWFGIPIKLRAEGPARDLHFGSNFFTPSEGSARWGKLAVHAS